MKKILIVLAISLFVSCSKAEPIECICTKTVSQQVSYTYWSGGLPHLGVRDEVLYSEEVGCQDEVTHVNTTDNMFYDITCE